MPIELTVALIGLGGVALGALLTWGVQERMFNRQRKKELDDQRREWKRKRLDDLATHLNQMVESFYKYRIADRSDEALQDFYKATGVFLTNVETSFDDELNRLVQDEFFPAAAIFGKGKTTEERVVIVQNLKRINFKAQRRIAELIEETFK